MADLPEHLYARGRAIDPVFASDEELYHRCSKESIIEDSLQPGLLRLKGAYLRFPDFSVNRQKYSRPEDVLLPDYRDMGVASFRHRDVPPTLTSEGGTSFQFRVEHVPLEDNYAHAEVRTYRADERVLRSSKVPDKVKSEFRQRLSEKCVIVIHPKA